MQAQINFALRGLPGVDDCDGSLAPAAVVSANPTTKMKTKRSIRNYVLVAFLLFAVNLFAAAVYNNIFGGQSTFTGYSNGMWSYTITNSSGQVIGSSNGQQVSWAQAYDAYAWSVLGGSGGGGGEMLN